MYYISWKKEIELNKTSQHIASFLKTTFFLLMPVYFVLHGVRENEGFVTLPDVLPLLGIYMIAALTLFALCWLLFRNRVKAAFGSFVLMSFHFSLAFFMIC